MKRGLRWLRYYVVGGVVFGVAHSAWAFGGPFEFNFAADFLSGILLWPLRLGGCG